MELSSTPFDICSTWACISCRIHHYSSQITYRKKFGILDGIYNIELATCTVVRNVSGPASSMVGGDLSAIVVVIKLHVRRIVTILLADLEESCLGVDIYTKVGPLRKVYLSRPSCPRSDLVHTQPATFSTAHDLSSSIYEACYSTPRTSISNYLNGMLCSINI